MLLKLSEEKEVIKINDEKFNDLIDQNLQDIIGALTDSGFKVRIVGGAVRDILIGQKPRDIDLITDATPDEIIFILLENDIEPDVWGARHGTIKAVIDNIKYEITSLDYQIFRNNEGNIVIQTTGDWEEDVKRRDFTVNAMSMDLDGTVYDYLNGIGDLRDQKIAPIPNFEEKIQKDPVMILRFFKMLAKFENPKTDKNSFKTVLKNMDLVKKLEKRRIRRELGNIRKSVNGKNTLKIMKKIGLLDILKSV